MDEAQALNRSRMTLLLIAGIPITVILVATWLWYYVVQGNLDLVAVLGTANQGVLVQPPREMDSVNLVNADGQSISYTELEPKWTFLIPGSSRCEAACEHSLYLTRQIHLAMGKEFHRIQRIYLSEFVASDTQLAVAHLSDDRPAPQSFSEYLSIEHRDLKVWHGTKGSVDDLLPEFVSDANTWYLIDPAGWIMMSYDETNDYKAVMSDLKFLLKNSSE